MNERNWNILVDSALESVENRPRHRMRMRHRLARSGKLGILREMYQGGGDWREIMHIIRKAALDGE